MSVLLAGPYGTACCSCRHTCAACYCTEHTGQLWHSGVCVSKRIETERHSKDAMRETNGPCVWSLRGWLRERVGRPGTHARHLGCTQFMTFCLSSVISLVYRNFLLYKRLHFLLCSTLVITLSLKHKPIVQLYKSMFLISLFYKLFSIFNI